MSLDKINIEKLSQDELFEIFESIPSDDSICYDLLDKDENEYTVEAICENTPMRCNMYDPDNVPLADRIENVEGIWEEHGLMTDPLPFQGKGGPNLPPGLGDPLSYFYLIFPESFIDYLVFQTNFYAHQKQKPFEPATSQSMKTFLAINLLMGIKKLPSYKDYWSSIPQLRDEYISYFIPLNRFSWFLSHMHLSDNNFRPNRNDINYDKLYRFKGRNSIKQYMPMKPIKRGYKVWIRADESGYICEFQIYTGKTDSVETTLGKRVVQDLTMNIEGKYHNVYFDNFFTSLELMEELLQDGIYACGTVRANRKGLPKIQIQDKKLKKGDSEGRVSTTGVSWLKWRDNRCIQLLSNFHNPDDISSCTRKNKDGSTISISCPLAVTNYNTHMGYVDYADMLKSYYEIDRKSQKWWHRIFFHFLDVSVVNAFILFRESSQGSTLNIKQFRLAVVAGLVGLPSTSPKGRKQLHKKINLFKPKIPIEQRFSNVGHLPQSCSSRRCNNCSTKDKPHRTKWE
ncbi:piggyBac transposable element-derived protein 4-like, partial [Acyrthosiphon pisum]|uniref:PiggyBac transposable element-derived protein domain-containing protein n=1 Tax=Acyrthosiphon pisum TaxID=7029 RepID=A0A8R2BA33_ACYPI